MNEHNVVAAALTPHLDGDDASPFKNKVTSFQVFIGGAAELNVHLLNDIKNKQTSHTAYTVHSEVAHFSLPSHCSPWQMQCGRCHHAGRNGASYVPLHLPQPSQSGSLQSVNQVSEAAI